MPQPNVTLVLLGPPVSARISPLVAPGLQFKPSRGAKAFQYVLVRLKGTPLSPGNTSPVGVTPAELQSVIPAAALYRGSVGGRTHGYIVEFCPGRKVCTLCPMSLSGVFNSHRSP